MHVFELYCKVINFIHEETKRLYGDDIGNFLNSDEVNMSNASRLFIEKVLNYDGMLAHYAVRNIYESSSKLNGTWIVDSITRTVKDNPDTYLTLKNGKIVVIDPTVRHVCNINEKIIFNLQTGSFILGGQL